MKRFLVATGGSAILALGVMAVPVANAATTKCQVRGSAYGNVKATNTTCAVASKVIRADTQGKSYAGFKCTSKAYQGGASVTCVDGSKKVQFQVAD